ncbi:hypothetical protein J32TS6_36850 [Virgibacillus pantothenticus]|nr:hypothetical protein J32TS6_36850 [Virgibacillus pantothenticus]
MDGKGRTLDNIITERLWRTNKYEEIYLKEHNSPERLDKKFETILHFITKSANTPIAKLPDT